MIKNIAEVEQSLGVEAGKLKEMITSEEETSIDLSERVFFSKEDFKDRINNIKKEHGNASVEMAVKQARKDYELDFEGKTISNLIKAIEEKAAAESKIEPEKKYTQLKEDFTKLQKNYEILNGDFESYKNKITERDTKAKIKNAFTSSISGETIVSKGAIYMEAKEKGYEFQIQDGEIVVLKNGEVQKHKTTLNPISVSDFTKEFAVNFIKKPFGGSGKGDEPGTVKQGSLEAFQAEAEKKGWNSMETNEEMAKRIKEGTLKL